MISGDILDRLTRARVRLLRMMPWSQPFPFRNFVNVLRAGKFHTSQPQATNNQLGSIPVQITQSLWSSNESKEIRSTSFARVSRHLPMQCLHQL